MHIAEIKYNSPEYRQMLVLRDEVLRKPLGISLDLSKLGSDESDFLIGCFEEDIIIGCVILTPINDKELKLRQMAVKKDLQGSGIGSEIVNWSEDFARYKGFKKMVMNARKYAIPFYEKLGYSVYGDEFTEVGIPHFKMTKDL
jgi:predicted GNAT family N-acyltransferase